MVSSFLMVIIVLSITVKVASLCVHIIYSYLVKATFLPFLTFFENISPNSRKIRFYSIRYNNNYKILTSCFCLYFRMLQHLLSCCRLVWKPRCTCQKQKRRKFINYVHFSYAQNYFLLNGLIFSYDILVKILQYAFFFYSCYGIRLMYLLFYIVGIYSSKNQCQLMFQVV